MTATSILAELAAASCRVRRRHAECPSGRRPSDRAIYRDLPAARVDVIQLAACGRVHEARAIVADWEREAASRIREPSELSPEDLAHSPLEASR